MQYLVSMPLGAVYRYSTCAVIATWGSIRYVIDARDRTSGVYECSISFKCRTGYYTDMLRAQLTPRGEVDGMLSTPETGPLVCTGAVSRFSAARGSIPICYARSERRPGMCPVSRFSAAHRSIPIFYTRSYRRQGKCTVCHRRPRQDIWRARV